MYYTAVWLARLGLFNTQYYRGFPTTIKYPPKKYSKILRETEKYRWYLGHWFCLDAWKSYLLLSISSPGPLGSSTMLFLSKFASEWTRVPSSRCIPFWTERKLNVSSVFRFYCVDRFSRSPNNCMLMGETFVWSFFAESAMGQSWCWAVHVQEWIHVYCDRGILSFRLSACLVM